METTVTVKQHIQVRQEEQLPAVLDLLKKAIWARRPILGEIMTKHGGKALAAYSRDFLDVNPTPELDSRKPELIALVKELTTERLGSEIADQVAKQLTRLPLVSTADHHGPISHPFWVNANIISHLPYKAAELPELTSLVVFSFASVSLNNASAFPRGFLFHGGLNGSGNVIRLPLLPDKLKMGVVYGNRPFATEDLERAQADLRRRQQAGEILPERAEKVSQLLSEVFSDAFVLGAPDLAAQITRLNHRLWPRLFHGADQQAETQRAPQLIYLDIETLVAQLLRRHHLTNSTSLLHRVLFDSAVRDHAIKAFDGIPGGFSVANHTGTFFFWAVDDKLHRVRLELVGDQLVSPDGAVKIDLTPGAIGKALADKKIFPSMLLCYLTIPLYYGMKCLGGFCQVHDLTMLKRAWTSILETIGEVAEAKALDPIQTKELGGDGMVLSYMKTPAGDYTPATGIDMILEPIDSRLEHYAELAERITMEEIMAPMLPEMYTVLYAITERDPALLRYNPEEIVRLTGLAQKLTQ